MPDERPSSDDLEELGLDAGDLGAFDVNAPIETGSEDDVGDQESTIEQSTALVTTEPTAPAKADQREESTEPAGRKAESQTPHAKAEAEARSTSKEQPAAAPGEQPTAPASPAPSPESTAIVPWTPSADGRRLALEGAVVEPNGDVRIPKATLPILQRHLADRTVWQGREQQYRNQLAALDPEHNEHVVLSRLLADEMDKASAKGDDALWEWVQGFQAALPRLRAEAKSAAIAAENTRLKQRIAPIDQEAERATIEPQLQEGLSSYLDQYLAMPQFAALVPDRAKLANRFWNQIRGEVFAIADKDYPEHGLTKGDPFVRLNVLERELLYAAELLEGKQAEAAAVQQRTAAEARNKAALGTAPVPPVPPVGSRTIADTAAVDGRPKTREAWVDRMERLASTP